MENGELLFSIENQLGFAQLKSNRTASVFASGTLDGSQIEVWDINARKLKTKILPDEGYKFWNRIAINNEGTQVAAFEVEGGDIGPKGMSGRVVLFEASSGDRTWVSDSMISAGVAGEFAFSNESHQLFFGIGKQQEVLFDETTGTPNMKFKSSLYLFESDSGKILRQEVASGLIHCAKFTNSNRVCFSGPFRNLASWNLETWEIDEVGEHSFSNICIFENAKRLVGIDMPGYFPGQTHYMRCYDTDTMQEIFQTPSPLEEFMIGSEMDISDRGEYLVIGQVSKAKIIKTNIGR